MSLTFNFHFFACFRSRNDHLQCHAWRMLWVQPTFKAVKARHGMNEKSIAVWRIFHFNHASLKYKTFSGVQWIWKDWKVDFWHSCRQLETKTRQLNYRATCPHVGDFSSAVLSGLIASLIFFSTYSCAFFSAMLAHFVSLYRVKNCQSRINVVVFTANRKFKFLQDDDAGL